MFKKSTSKDRRTGTAAKKIIALSLVTLLLGYLLRTFTRDEKIYKFEPEAAKPDASKPEAAKPEAAKPEAAKPDNRPKATTPESLKVVEGIGPKIQSILYAQGINTLRQLANSEPEQLRDILRQEGSRYLAHDPATWPKQAGLAAAKDWDGLDAYKSQLKGGREVK
ncbi:MAG: hypothetical protein WA958_08020 [Tunicatimonas sp.]